MTSLRHFSTTSTSIYLVFSSFQVVCFRQAASRAVSKSLPSRNSQESLSLRFFNRRASTNFVSLPSVSDLVIVEHRRLVFDCQVVDFTDSSVDISSIPAICLGRSASTFRQLRASRRLAFDFRIVDHRRFSFVDFSTSLNRFSTASSFLNTGRLFCDLKG